jgi:predicted nucleic acid-binding protein
MEIQADYILLDEKEGRHVAQRMGLRPLGVIGILLLAKNKGLLKKVKPKLNLLKSKANFYINESLFNFILKAANE